MSNLCVCPYFAFSFLWPGRRSLERNNEKTHNPLSNSGLKEGRSATAAAAAAVQIKFARSFILDRYLVWAVLGLSTAVFIFFQDTQQF